MSKIQESVQAWAANIQASLSETIKSNANLVTGFLVTMVLVAGLGLVNGRETWWMTALAFGFTFLVVFLAINARVVIKFALSIMVLSFSSTFALVLGVGVKPTTTLGFLWLGAQMFIYAFCVAVSYLSTGHKSRWTGVSLALLLNMALVMGFTDLAGPSAGVGIATICSIVGFLIYYRWDAKWAAKPKLMPATVASTQLFEAVKAHAGHEGWEWRELKRKARRQEPAYSDFLIWNEKHAYLLHPVALQNKFGADSNRKANWLTHRGASINPWLLTLVNKLVPAWRSRNAPIMIILMDTTNKNGTKPETIGAAIPDSKKRIPVGIWPAKGFTANTEKKTSVLEAMEETYSPYFPELKEKQKKAMSEIGETPK